MSIPQAFRGALVEMDRLPTAWQKVQYVGRSACLFAEEVVGTLARVPYAIKAASLHRALTNYRSGAASSAVSIARGVRYGPGTRHLLDIYVPPAKAEDQHAGASTRVAAADGALPDSRPVVLFVHGGVWASGEAWHYAPMAHCLATLGVVTCVATYSLFPAATSDAMVQDVSDALTYVMDNISEYRGDASRVALFGHSAGAHLCAMALLHRAVAAGQRPGSPSGLHAQHAHRRDGRSPHALPVVHRRPQPRHPDGSLCTSDDRMPRLAVLAAGVYDISRHYEYEEERGVHMLSTMERALGGWHAFPQRSPLVLLHHALRAARLRPHGAALSPRAALSGSAPGQTARAPASGTSVAKAAVKRKGSSQTAAKSAKRTKTSSTAASAPAGTRSQESSAPASSGASAVPDVVAQAAMLNPPDRGPRFYSSFDLQGDAIAHRIFGQSVATHASAGKRVAWADQDRSIVHAIADVEVHRSSDLQGVVDSVAGAQDRTVTRDGATEFAASLTLDAVRRLPPVALLSSCTDLTVPWYESAEFSRYLQDARVPVRNLVYHKMGHADFVVEWPVTRLSAAEVSAKLAPFARDIVALVHGQVALATDRPLDTDSG